MANDELISSVLRDYGMAPALPIINNLGQFQVGGDLPAHIQVMDAISPISNFNRFKEAAQPVVEPNLMGGAEANIRDKYGVAMEGVGLLGLAPDVTDIARVGLRAARPALGRAAQTVTNLVDEAVQGSVKTPLSSQKGSIGSKLDDLPMDEASRMARDMSEDEFIKHHKTGFIEPGAYRQYEAEGGLSWLGGPKVEPITELPEGKFDVVIDRAGGKEKYFLSRSDTAYARPEFGMHETEQGAIDEGIRIINEQRGVGKSKAEKYPDLVGQITGKGGKKYEVRKSRVRLGYSKKDATGEIMRDDKGLAVSMTPEEIKAAGLPEFEKDMAVFDGDKPVALVSDEFGAIGVYVEEKYQRQGIGSKLLAQYMRENPSTKIGQMTPAGEEMSRAAYRILKNSNKDILN